MTGPTFDIGLTKASNASVHFEFILARGKDEQPRISLGSREKEAAKAGQRGVISIQSLHRGSGQHVARDPMMYEFADGMFADEPGVLKTRGDVAKTAIASAQPLWAWSRGALRQVFGTQLVAVTPTQIYTHVDGTPNTALSPLANCYFTGSVATLGDHVFFGQEHRDGWRTSTYAARLTIGNGVFSNNAGFKAGYLAAQAEKLWAVEALPGAAAIDLRWSDDAGNASPVFSSAYRFASGRDAARDLGILGPHAVLATTGLYSKKGRLLTVDATGAFTDLLSELPPLYNFVPFLGGQFLWSPGRPRGLWLRGPTSYTEVSLSATTPSFGEACNPVWHKTGSSGTPGVGATAQGGEMFFPVYGTVTKRDGNSVNGTVIVQARLTEEGFRLHTVAGPEGTADLENAFVMASMLEYDSTETPATDPTNRKLRLLLATPEANANNSTIEALSLDLWEGSAPPVFDTDTKFLRTSRYVGDSWTTKQGELLRGYITKLPANSSVVARLYLDGSENETYNFSINTAGPFAQSLPSSIIGRDVALDIETNANGAVVIEFPWSLDYFAVPDKKDIARLPVIAGRDQPTPGGVLTTRTRAQVLADVETLVASKEKWTLEWKKDATPDWDVIPLSYEETDIEPAPTPGSGAAVAWITLQRL